MESKLAISQDEQTSAQDTALPDSSSTPLGLKKIYQVWWPLALGWILMTVEIPILVAIVARSANPEINLAAWGITFFVTLIIGSPAIMLLATSTALSRDWLSFLTLRRYALSLLGILTGLHACIVFTPLYHLVVAQLIGAPAEIIEPARQGLIILIPWAIGVGYRRFNYGLLIRFGHSKAVTHGVFIRLSVNTLVLLVCFNWTQMSGVVMASTAFIIGIAIEACYAHWRVQPALNSLRQNSLRQNSLQQDELQQSKANSTEQLNLAAFSRFFIPLALTSILQMAVQPIVSAALSRMPEALASLAIWPVIFSLLIIFTSAGTAFTEVVVVLLKDKQSSKKLWQFSKLIMLVSTGLLMLMALTPLSELWFRHVAALPQDLVNAAVWGLWFVLPMPLLRVLESVYQGRLMVANQTQGISESVVIYLAICGGILWLGVQWGSISGLFIGLLAAIIAETARTGWLWKRAGVGSGATRA